MSHQNNGSSSPGSFSVRLEVNMSTGAIGVTATSAAAGQGAQPEQAPTSQILRVSSAGPSYVGGLNQLQPVPPPTQLTRQAAGHGGLCKGPGNPSPPSHRHCSRRHTSHSRYNHPPAPPPSPVSTRTSIGEESSNSSSTSGIDSGVSDVYIP